MYTIPVPRTGNWKTCSGQRQLYVEGGRLESCGILDIFNLVFNSEIYSKFKSTNKDASFEIHKGVVKKIDFFCTSNFFFTKV